MTPSQLTLFKTAILAETDPTFVALRAGGETGQMAEWFNVPSTFIAWKNSVTNEAIGDAMNGTEVAGLSSLQMQRLQVLGAYSNGTQNPSRADRRAAFDAVFSGAGGTITRPALLALWKRAATRGEKVFATGVGSDATPGSLTFEGTISNSNITDALVKG